MFLDYGNKAFHLTYFDFTQGGKVGPEVGKGGLFVCIYQPKCHLEQLGTWVIFIILFFSSLYFCGDYSLT